MFVHATATWPCLSCLTCGGEESKLCSFSSSGVMLPSGSGLSTVVCVRFLYLGRNKCSCSCSSSGEYRPGKGKAGRWACRGLFPPFHLDSTWAAVCGVQHLLLASSVATDYSMNAFPSSTLTSQPLFLSGPIPVVLPCGPGIPRQL